MTLRAWFCMYAEECFPRDPLVFIHTLHKTLPSRLLQTLLSFCSVKKSSKEAKIKNNGTHEPFSFAMKASPWIKGVNKNLWKGARVLLWKPLWCQLFRARCVQILCYMHRYNEVVRITQRVWIITVAWCVHPSEKKINRHAILSLFHLEKICECL